MKEKDGFWESYLLKELINMQNVKPIKDASDIFNGIDLPFSDDFSCLHKSDGINVIMSIISAEGGTFEDIIFSGKAFITRKHSDFIKKETIKFDCYSVFIFYNCDVCFLGVGDDKMFKINSFIVFTNKDELHYKLFFEDSVLLDLKEHLDSIKKQ